MAWEGAIAVHQPIEVVFMCCSSNQQFWEVSLVGSLTLPRKLNVSPGEIEICFICKVNLHSLKGVSLA